MSAENFPKYRDDIPPQKRSNGFFMAVLLVGILTIGFANFFRGQLRNAFKPDDSEWIGKEFPPVEAAGWFNRDSQTPIQDELKGQIYVVDAWAFWCGPCQASVPSVIELHKKYSPKGVKFLGLTAEGYDYSAGKEDPVGIEESEKFVKGLRIPWPNGYGAEKTLTALQVDSIPQLWVVDRTNKIVYHGIGWDPSDVGKIEHIIEEALNAK